MSSLLSQVVHLQSSEGSLREKLPVKINEITHRYSALGYNCSANCLSSFVVLKDLLGFFDQYHAKQYNLALKVRILFLYDKIYTEEVKNVYISV